MPTVRATLAARGEDAAADLYRRRGYAVVARNWRCSIGELDLVLRRGDTLVVCEVKTRRGARLGGGYEAVDARKQRKLRALAEVFLLTHRLAPAALRFDVASVAVRSGPTSGDAVSVELFDDAF